MLLYHNDLYPALDDEQNTEQASAQVQKHSNIFIDIKGDEPYPQTITEFLRQIFHNGDTNEGEQFQVKYSKNQKTAHITLPKSVIDDWMKPKGLHI